MSSRRMNVEPSSKPRVAATMGDPCGVGPEILWKALANRDVLDACRPVVLGDAAALERAGSPGRFRRTFRVVRDLRDSKEFERDERVPLVAVASLSSQDLAWGKPTENACRAVVSSIEEAVALALEGRVDAVCTCPIHKGSLHRHGFPFPGHTEFLQRLTGADHAVMMMAGPRLRVALATIHEPLSRVPALLTRERLERVARIVAASLKRDFGISVPRVALAALNPHAGEEGRFGREELDLLSPLVEALSREDGWEVSGPHAADTLFHRAYEGEFDAVVAMYHDQGLIPVKLVHFHEAVNTTLGLPIVRTSVDHGTAYDIAGTGRAREGSLVAAMKLAASMALHRGISKRPS